MALVTPTLSSAVSLTDTTMVVSPATGIAAGMAGRCDSEGFKVAQNYLSGTTIPILRGQDGSVTATHKSGANVSFGTAADFAAPPAGSGASVSNPAGFGLGPIYSYSASGAIANVPGIHVLNGTSVLTMTMTSPTKDQDGAVVILASNGKAAHTVTYTTTGFGAGGGASDALTFIATQQQAAAMVALNGVWVLVGTVAAAATVAAVGLA